MGCDFAPLGDPPRAQVCQYLTDVDTDWLLSWTSPANGMICAAILTPCWTNQTNGYFPRALSEGRSSKRMSTADLGQPGRMYGILRGAYSDENGHLFQSMVDTRSS
jgi:hypothetical protein